MRMDKTLYLLRHAKSSWEDATLADHDRPLVDASVSSSGNHGPDF